MRTYSTFGVWSLYEYHNSKPQKPILDVATMFQSLDGYSQTANAAMLKLVVLYSISIMIASSFPLWVIVSSFFYFRTV